MVKQRPGRACQGVFARVFLGERALELVGWTKPMAVFTGVPCPPMEGLGEQKGSVRESLFFLPDLRTPCSGLWAEPKTLLPAGPGPRVPAADSGRLSLHGRVSQLRTVRLLIPNLLSYHMERSQ